jgi:hypothetical protein
MVLTLWEETLMSRNTNQAPRVGLDSIDQEMEDKEKEDIETEMVGQETEMVDQEMAMVDQEIEMEVQETEVQVVVVAIEIISEDIYSSKTSASLIVN